MGQFEDAIGYSMKAIREYPNDPDIYYNVGVLYQKMAIELFEKWLLPSTHTPGAWMT